MLLSLTSLLLTFLPETIKYDLLGYFCNFLHKKSTNLFFYKNNSKPYLLQP